MILYFNREKSPELLVGGLDGYIVYDILIIVREMYKTKNYNILAQILLSNVQMRKWKDMTRKFKNQKKTSQKLQ